MLAVNPAVPCVIVDNNSIPEYRAVAESDCACPLTLTPRPVEQSLASFASEPILYQAPITPIPGPADFTILMSAHTNPGLALLNSCALKLWQQFEPPNSPAMALQRLGLTDDRAAFQDAIAVLYQTGFLCQSAAPPVAFAHEDTLIAWLHTTNACNLRCNYCYLAKTNERMDESIGRQAIDAVFRSAMANGFSKLKIKYGGGEATLNFALVTSLHDYARQLAGEKNFSVDGVVLSNGVRLTREMIQSMLARQLRLMISLDGLGPIHDAQRAFAGGRGSFAEVARHIEMAQSLGLTPDICVTVSGHSAAGLPDLIGWILERDLPFSLNFYRENEFSASFADLQLDEERIIQGLLAAFKVLERNLPRRSLLASLIDRANLAAPHSRPCAAGHSYLVIDHFGHVAKCQMEIDKPVTNIAARDPLAVVRADSIGIQNSGFEEKEGCRECEWKYWCAGGCPQATFRATGRYDIKSPNCRIYKALYPEALRLEALRLIKFSQA